MYVTDVSGQVVSDAYLKEAIEQGDFLTAHYLVSRFICKRNVMGIHKVIMGNQAENDKTLDLAPRGFGKSTVGDVDYCITEILRNANIRIMIGSKTQTQAEAFLKEIRLHFEANEDLRRIFGDWVSDNWSNREFTVNKRTTIKKEATVTALGASGAVVSKHFDIIVADDIVGFENARTELQREKLRDWFYSSLLPTLEPNGKLRVLGTRYHPMDLYQDFINTGNYSVRTQRAIRNKNGVEVSLWPDKFTLEVLLEKKAEAGQIIFAMQYQNDVELAKGKIFKAGDFRYHAGWQWGNGGGMDKQQVYVRVPIDTKERHGNASGVETLVPVRIYMGVDLAISQKETADYFVLTVIGVDENKNIYLLEQLKERLTFDQQFNKIVQYGNKFPNCVQIAIESNAYQLAMAQELKRSTTLPVMELHTNKDKVARAMRRSAIFENGKVFLGRNMGSLEECLLLFPDVEHDDEFDSFDFACTAYEKRNNVKALDRGLFNI